MDVKKIIKRSFIVVFALTLLFIFLPHYHVFAADSSSIAETTFFGNLQDDGKGCGVYTILNSVVDILSVGIGILGVVGITVVGIQYLTAGGNEQQTVKAKRRMTEIVIGLIAYVILYAFAQWLLPGGKLSTNSACQTVSDEQLAEMKKAEQEAKAQAQAQAQAANNNTSSTGTQTGSGLTLSAQIAKKYTPEKMAKLIDQGKLAPSPVCTNCTWSERIAQTAELLAWPKGTSRNKYTYTGSVGGYNYKKWSDLKQGKPNEAYQKALDTLKPRHGFSSMGALGADCGHFVTIALKYSGYNRGMSYGQADEYLLKHGWKTVGSAKRGDVCIARGGSGTGFHTWIYLGDGLSAEANYTGKSFGHIVRRNCRNATTILRVK